MPPAPKITKADLAKKTHKPHGGSKDSNTAMQGKKDAQKLRKLNAEIAAAQKKRDALAAAAKKKTK